MAKKKKGTQPTRKKKGTQGQQTTKGKQGTSAKSALLLDKYQEEDLERLRNFRLIDDTFFSRCLRYSRGAVEKIVQTVMVDKTIKIKVVRVQDIITNNRGRSGQLDIIAVDENGKVYDVEIQRDGKKGPVKRGRYHGSLLDTTLLRKKMPFNKIPDVAVVFVTEDNPFKMNCPFRIIETYFHDADSEGNWVGNLEKIDVGQRLIYVNGTYRDDEKSEIGKMLHDFFCSDPEDMLIKELRTAVRDYKTSERGIREMCQIMEDLRQETRQESVKAERCEMARLMLAAGEPVEKIVRYSRLSEEEVRELMASENH